jgi:hypothetical protein
MEGIYATTFGCVSVKIHFGFFSDSTLFLMTAGRGLVPALM